MGTYCMILLILNSGNCKLICSDRKQISSFLEMRIGVGRCGKDGLQRDKRTFLG